VSVSPQFLTDLEHVHASLAGTGASLGPQFWTELEAVYAADCLSTAPPADFTFLAERLDAWRRQTQQRLATMLQRVPEDDPLRCPVSLFGTMDYGRLEVAHTRTLAWLLDPTKEHGFGDALLRTWVCQLLDAQGCREFSVSRVEPELFIESGPGIGGRIDVLAEGHLTDGAAVRRWMLVVEAKIDAGEGEEQLGRYDRWIEEYADEREVLRVFLTPGGWEGETGEFDWQPLSFLDLVRILRSAMETVRNAPGYHFLRYYLSGVLRDVCGWSLPINADCPDPYSVLRYLETMLHVTGGGR
jgi:hypothetical protein